MTDLVSSPTESCALSAQQYPHTWPWGVVALPRPFVLPTGSLRIGGDSPSGLVLAGGVPAARVVRLLDMASGELIAQTTSAGDGTYAFSGLSARTDGYATWIVGATGERGVINPAVMPG